MNDEWVISEQESPVFESTSWLRPFWVEFACLQALWLPPKVQRLACSITVSSNGCLCLDWQPVQSVPHIQSRVSSLYSISDPFYLYNSQQQEKTPWIDDRLWALGRKNCVLTGRNLDQNQAQGGTSVPQRFGGVSGKEKKKKRGCWLQKMDIWINVKLQIA